MKVGMLGPYLSHSSGGVFYAMAGLALALDGLSGVQLEIFGLQDAHTLEDSAAWGELSLHAHGICGPEAFGFSKRLSSDLQASAPDVLHSHGLWMYRSVAGLGWARRTGNPYMVSPHGMLDVWALRNSGLKKKIAALLYERRFLHGAACLHALCQPEAQAMRAFGLKNPICIIPNGVEQPGGEEVPPPVWHEMLPDGAKVLLYLGRLHPKKGLSELLRAWGRVQRQGAEGVHDWHLVIAGWGEGGYEEELRNMAGELNVEGSVHFPGAQFAEAKHAAYAWADAFILPSHSEGLPMVVLEAWIQGLPVLMTSHCNIPQGFTSSAAMQIEPEVESICKGVEALVRMQDGERMQMGLNGKALVEKQYTWPRVADEMHAVYQWMLRGGQAPACVTSSDV